MHVEKQSVDAGGGSAGPAGGEETELIHQCRIGHPAAWSALMKRHHQFLFSVAYRITLQREEAEDAMQESWVRIARSLKGFDQRSSFRTWATRIVVRQALTLRSQRKPGISLDASVEASQPSHLAAAVVEEIEIENALATLAPEERAAVVLHYAEGYTFQEVALILEVPQRTAADRAYRGLRRLREQLSIGMKPEKEFG